MRRDRDKGGGRPEFCGEGVQISAMAGNEICALFLIDAAACAECVREIVKTV